MADPKDPKKGLNDQESAIGALHDITNDKEHTRSLAHAAQLKADKDRDLAKQARFQFFTHAKPFDKADFTPAEKTYARLEFVRQVEDKFNELKELKGKNKKGNYGLIFDNSKGVKEMPDIILDQAISKNKITLSLQVEKDTIAKMPTHADWVKSFDAHPAAKPVASTNGHLVTAFKALPDRKDFNLFVQDNGNSVTFHALDKEGKIHALSTDEMKELSKAVQTQIQAGLAKAKLSPPAFYTHPEGDDLLLKSINAVKAELKPVPSDYVVPTPPSKNEPGAVAKAFTEFDNAVNKLLFAEKRSSRPTTSRMTKAGQALGRVADKAADAYAASGADETQKQALQFKNDLKYIAEDFDHLLAEQLKDWEHLLNVQSFDIKEAEDTHATQMAEALEKLQQAQAEEMRVTIQHDPLQIFHETQNLSAALKTTQTNGFNKKKADLEKTGQLKMQKLLSGQKSERDKLQEDHATIRKIPLDARRKNKDRQKDELEALQKKQQNRLEIEIKKLDRLPSTMENLQHKQRLKLQKFHQAEEHGIGTEELHIDHLKQDLDIQNSFLDHAQKKLAVLEKHRPLPPRPQNIPLEDSIKETENAVKQISAKIVTMDAKLENSKTNLYNRKIEFYNKKRDQSEQMSHLHLDQTDIQKNLKNQLKIIKKTYEENLGNIIKAQEEYVQLDNKKLNKLSQDLNLVEQESKANKDPSKELKYLETTHNLQEQIAEHVQEMEIFDLKQERDRKQLYLTYENNKQKFLKQEINKIKKVIEKLEDQKSIFKAEKLLAAQNAGIILNNEDSFEDIFITGHIEQLQLHIDFFQNHFELQSNIDNAVKVSNELTGKINNLSEIHPLQKDLLNQKNYVSHRLTQLKTTQTPIKKDLLEQQKNEMQSRQAYGAKASDPISLKKHEQDIENLGFEHARNLIALDLNDTKQAKIFLEQQLRKQAQTLKEHQSKVFPFQQKSFDLYIEQLKEDIQSLSNKYNQLQSNVINLETDLQSIDRHYIELVEIHKIEMESARTEQKIINFESAYQANLKKRLENQKEELVNADKKINLSKYALERVTATDPIETLKEQHPKELAILTAEYEKIILGLQHIQKNNQFLINHKKETKILLESEIEQQKIIVSQLQTQIRPTKKDPFVQDESLYLSPFKVQKLNAHIEKLELFIQSLEKQVHTLDSEIKPLEILETQQSIHIHIQKLQKTREELNQNTKNQLIIFKLEHDKALTILRSKHAEALTQSQKQIDELPNTPINSIPIAKLQHEKALLDIDHLITQKNLALEHNKTLRDFLIKEIQKQIAARDSAVIPAQHAKLFNKYLEAFNDQIDDLKQQLNVAENKIQNLENKNGEIDQLTQKREQLKQGHISEIAKFNKYFQDSEDIDALEELAADMLKDTRRQVAEAKKDLAQTFEEQLNKLHTEQNDPNNDFKFEILQCQTQLNNNADPLKEQSLNLSLEKAQQKQNILQKEYTITENKVYITNAQKTITVLKAAAELVTDFIKKEVKINDDSEFKEKFSGIMKGVNGYIDSLNTEIAGLESHINQLKKDNREIIDEIRIAREMKSTSQDEAIPQKNQQYYDDLPFDQNQFFYDKAPVDPNVPLQQRVIPEAGILRQQEDLAGIIAKAKETKGSKTSPEVGTSTKPTTAAVLENSGIKPQPKQPGNALPPLLVPIPGPDANKPFPRFEHPPQDATLFKEQLNDIEDKTSVQAIEDNSDTFSVGTSGGNFDSIRENLSAPYRILKSYKGNKKITDELTLYDKELNKDLPDATAAFNHLKNAASQATQAPGPSARLNDELEKLNSADSYEAYLGKTSTKTQANDDTRIASKLLERVRNEFISPLFPYASQEPPLNNPHVVFPDNRIPLPKTNAPESTLDKNASDSATAPQTKDLRTAEIETLIKKTFTNKNEQTLIIKAYKALKGYSYIPIVKKAVDNFTMELCEEKPDQPKAFDYLKTAASLVPQGHEKQLNDALIALQNAAYKGKGQPASSPATVTKAASAPPPVAPAAQAVQPPLTVSVAPAPQPTPTAKAPATAPSTTTALPKTAPAQQQQPPAPAATTTAPQSKPQPVLPTQSAPPTVVPTRVAAAPTTIEQFTKNQTTFEENMGKKKAENEKLQQASEKKQATAAETKEESAFGEKIKARRMVYDDAIKTLEKKHEAGLSVIEKKIVENKKSMSKHKGNADDLTDLHADQLMEKTFNYEKEKTLLNNKLEKLNEAQKSIKDLLVMNAERLNSVTSMLARFPKDVVKDVVNESATFILENNIRNLNQQMEEKTQSISETQVKVEALFNQFEIDSKNLVQEQAGEVFKQQILKISTNYNTELGKLEKAKKVDLSSIEAQIKSNQKSIKHDLKNLHEHQLEKLNLENKKQDITLRHDLAKLELDQAYVQNLLTTHTTRLNSRAVKTQGEILKLNENIDTFTTKLKENAALISEKQEALNALPTQLVKNRTSLIEKQQQAKKPAPAATIPPQKPIAAATSTTAPAVTTTPGNAASTSSTTATSPNIVPAKAATPAAATTTTTAPQKELPSTRPQYTTSVQPAAGQTTTTAPATTTETLPPQLPEAPAAPYVAPTSGTRTVEAPPISSVKATTATSAAQEALPTAPPPYTTAPEVPVIPAAQTTTTAPAATSTATQPPVPATPPSPSVAPTVATTGSVSAPPRAAEIPPASGDLKPTQEISSLISDFERATTTLKKELLDSEASSSFDHKVNLIAIGNKFRDKELEIEKITKPKTKTPITKYSLAILHRLQIGLLDLKKENEKAILDFGVNIANSRIEHLTKLQAHYTKALTAASEQMTSPDQMATKHINNLQKEIKAAKNEIESHKKIIEDNQTKLKTIDALFLGKKDDLIAEQEQETKQVELTQEIDSLISTFTSASTTLQAKLLPEQEELSGLHEFQVRKSQGKINEKKQEILNKAQDLSETKGSIIKLHALQVELIDLQYQHDLRVLERKVEMAMFKIKLSNTWLDEYQRALESVETLSAKLTSPYQPAIDHIQFLTAKIKYTHNQLIALNESVIVRSPNETEKLERNYLKQQDNLRDTQKTEIEEVAKQEREQQGLIDDLRRQESIIHREFTDFLNDNKNEIKTLQGKQTLEINKLNATIAQNAKEMEKPENITNPALQGIELSLKHQLEKMELEHKIAIKTIRLNQAPGIMKALQATTSQIESLNFRGQRVNLFFSPPEADNDLYDEATLKSLLSKDTKSLEEMNKRHEKEKSSLTQEGKEKNLIAEVKKLKYDFDNSLMALNQGFEKQKTTLAESHQDNATKVRREIGNVENEITNLKTTNSNPQYLEILEKNTKPQLEYKQALNTLDAKKEMAELQVKNLTSVLGEHNKVIQAIQSKTQNLASIPKEVEGIINNLNKKIEETNDNLKTNNAIISNYSKEKTKLETQYSLQQGKRGGHEVFEQQAEAMQQLIAKGKTQAALDAAAQEQKSIEKLITRLQAEIELEIDPIYKKQEVKIKEKFAPINKNIAHDKIVLERSKVEVTGNDDTFTAINDRRTAELPLREQIATLSEEIDLKKMNVTHIKDKIALYSAYLEPSKNLQQNAKTAIKAEITTLETTLSTENAKIPEKQKLLAATEEKLQALRNPKLTEQKASQITPTSDASQKHTAKAATAQKEQLLKEQEEQLLRQQQEQEQKQRQLQQETQAKEALKEKMRTQLHSASKTIPTTAPSTSTPTATAATTTTATPVATTTTPPVANTPAPQPVVTPAVASTTSAPAPATTRRNPKTTLTTSEPRTQRDLAIAIFSAQHAIKDKILTKVLTKDDIEKGVAIPKDDMLKAELQIQDLDDILQLNSQIKDFTNQNEEYEKQKDALKKDDLKNSNLTYLTRFHSLQLKTMSVQFLQEQEELRNKGEIIKNNLELAENKLKEYMTYQEAIKPIPISESDNSAISKLTKEVVKYKTEIDNQPSLLSALKVKQENQKQRTSDTQTKEILKMKEKEDKKEEAIKALGETLTSAFGKLRDQFQSEKNGLDYLLKISSHLEKKSESSNFSHENVIENFILEIIEKATTNVNFLPSAAQLYSLLRIFDALKHELNETNSSKLLKFMYYSTINAVENDDTAVTSRGGEIRDLLNDAKYSATFAQMLSKTISSCINNVVLNFNRNTYEEIIITLKPLKALITKELSQHPDAGSLKLALVLLAIDNNSNLQIHDKKRLAGNLMKSWFLGDANILYPYQPASQLDIRTDLNILETDSLEEIENKIRVITAMEGIRESLTILSLDLKSLRLLEIHKTNRPKEVGLQANIDILSRRLDASKELNFSQEERDYLNIAKAVINISNNFGASDEKESVIKNFITTMTAAVDKEPLTDAQMNIIKEIQGSKDSGEIEKKLRELEKTPSAAVKLTVVARATNDAVEALQQKMKKGVTSAQQGNLADDTNANSSKNNSNTL